jgi:hypothetical protein
MLKFKVWTRPNLKSFLFFQPPPPWLHEESDESLPERCGPSASSAPPKATRTSTRQRSAGKLARINTNNNI